MMATRFRKSLNLSVAASMSSIITSPSMHARRNSAPINELFPAPVLPTIPKSFQKLKALFFSTNFFPITELCYGSLTNFLFRFDYK